MSDPTLGARLTSTFWLLLNTPMIPPEKKPQSEAVQLTDFSAKRSSHSRETSVRVRVEHTG